MDNQQITNGGLRELALFAGAGGGILAGHLLGWRTVCAVEWGAYPASVLVARQNEGFLPPFPIWDDVQTFDGKPWRGLIDVVSGGFPCQDISAAGKGAGIDGPRSGMWAHMARIIREVEPRYCFVENSPMLTSRGLGRVLGDMAAMGYNAKWGVLGAHHVGAPHKRDRIWIRAELADASQLQRNGCDDHARIGIERKSLSEFGNDSGAQDVADAGHLCGRDGAEPIETQPAAFTGCSEMGNAMRSRLEGVDAFSGDCGDASKCSQVESIDSANVGGKSRASWWEAEPDVGRMADGVAARVDRLKAIGNGQVSVVADRAWRMLA